MSISSEIQRISGKVSDSFDAVVAKGGTVTSRKLDDLPTAIGTISGGTPATKYGASVDAFLGDVDANGVLQYPSDGGALNFAGVRVIDKHGLLAFKFRHNAAITSVNLSSLTTISGSSAMEYCFDACTSLTTVDLSSLTTISGISAMEYCFLNCSGLTTVNLSSLTTISGTNAMKYCFWGCSGLTTVNLSSLTTISGSSAMGYCFWDCSGLTTVNLSSLTSISSATSSADAPFSRCFYGCIGLTTVTIGGTTPINFGVNRNVFNDMFSGCYQASGIDLYIATDETTLSQLSGYPKFGASSSCEVRIHYTATA